MTASSMELDLLAVVGAELRSSADGNRQALATLIRAAAELRQAAFMATNEPLPPARGYRDPAGRLTARYSTARAALTPVLASEVRTS